MADFTTPVDERLLRASQAVSHCLNRVVHDPDFRWHMLGTQSLHELLEARAALWGQTPEESEADLMKSIDARPYSEIGKPQLIEARDKIGAVEKWVGRHFFFGVQTRAVEEEQLQHLVDVIDGHPLPAEYQDADA